MAIIVMAGAVLVQNGDRIARAFRASAHCVVVEPAPALGSVQQVDPASPCVQIEQVRAGVSYGIALEQIEPFVDWHIPAPVGGFASARMLRRWSEGRRRAPRGLRLWCQSAWTASRRR